jgi:hypothetical protein
MSRCRRIMRSATDRPCATRPSEASLRIIPEVVYADTPTRPARRDVVIGVSSHSEAAVRQQWTEFELSFPVGP